MERDTLLLVCPLYSTISGVNPQLIRGVICQNLLHFFRGDIVDQKKIGEFICKLRKEKGYTQAALAEMLSISNRTISKWENGDGLPDVSILPDLARTLGVSVDELLSGEKREIAELKVTEIESKGTVNNWFQITYIVAMFLGVFGAILGFVTLAYNIWAFNILFYNHWEIMFVAISLCVSVLSALFFSIGVTKLKLNYTKEEILSLAGKRGLVLGMILSVLPNMFILRIIDVSRFGEYIGYLAAVIFVIWLVAVLLVRRKLNEKDN